MAEKKEVPVLEIARSLGVSPTTVSRALSGNGRVSRETRDRILTYIEANQILPHSRGTNYSSRKSMNIAVVLPKEEEYAQLPYFTNIMLALYDFFCVYGYHVLIVRTKDGNIETLKDVVKKHKIDGAVLTRILDSCEDIQFLKKAGVPFVVTGSIDDEDVYQADVNQRGGCRELTDILLKKGIRKMALFSAGLRQTVARDRLNGYLDALRENDLPIEYDLIVKDTLDINVLEKAVRDILKEQVECVICGDDGTCLTVLDYFRQLGIKVPRDIRVASFFNSALLEEANSYITSIEFDIRKLGNTAGEMLIRLLNGEPCEKKKVLGYKILIKESTKMEGAVHEGGTVHEGTVREGIAVKDR